MDRRPPPARFARTRSVRTANDEPATDAVVDEAAIARAFVAGELAASDHAPRYEQGMLARASAMIVVCLLVPASLVPFAFDVSTVPGAWWQAVAWRQTSTEDLLVNWLVYVPLGIAVCAALRGRVGWFVAGFLAATFGAGLSTLIEMLQAGIPQRVASWTDVSLNAAGTICGVAMAPAVVRLWKRIARGLGDGLALQPMTVGACVLAFGLLAMDLLPFDFVTSTHRLHESLIQSQWWTIPSPPAAGEGVAWFALLGILGAVAGGALLFIVLGFLAALGGRERGLDRPAAWDAAVGHGVIVAFLIEVLRIFMTSATFSFAEIVLHGAAAVFGAYVAIRLFDGPSESSWLVDRNIVLRPLLMPLTVAQIVCIVVAQLAMPWGVSGDSLSGAVNWAPFALQFWQPFPAAIDEIGSMFVTFALIALTSAFALRRDADGPNWSAALAVVVAVAMVREIIRCLNTTVSADVTSLILAVLAVEGTSRLVESLRHRVARAPHSDHSVAEFAQRVSGA